MLEDRSDRISRADPRLLSEQVASDLRQEIAEGRLSGRLPGEQELSDQYGVGRITIRRAVATLVQEGRVVVVRGRGTFVHPADPD